MSGAATGRRAYVLVELLRREGGREGGREGDEGWHAVAEACAPLTDSASDAQVEWCTSSRGRERKRFDWHGLAGQVIRLRYRMHCADVFSMQFAR